MLAPDMSRAIGRRFLLVLLLLVFQYLLLSLARVGEVRGRREDRLRGLEDADLERLDDADPFVATPVAPTSAAEAVPRLYVDVSGWMEGMSSWMIGLAEILVLCRELNATFVSPCIRNGRLGSCQNGGLGLWEVLDLERVRAYHPDIVSYPEYVRRTRGVAADPGPNTTAAAVFHICMHHFSATPSCGDVPLLYGSHFIPQIDQARRAVALNRTPAVVLRIQSYGRYGFRKSTWVADAEVERVRRNYLRLASRHDRQVDALLQRMGLTLNNGSFSVIHWRAEKPGLDYLSCAQRLMDAREMMQRKLPANHSFILMSSLNTHDEVMWAGARNMAANSSSQEALRRLLDAGFRKLDQVLDYGSLADPVLVAVYDLLLALKARKFVTCTKSCSDASVCAACNWRGEFGQLAVSFRSLVENKTSTQCWPEVNPMEKLLAARDAIASARAKQLRSERKTVKAPP